MLSQVAPAVPLVVEHHSRRQIGPRPFVGKGTLRFFGVCCPNRVREPRGHASPLVASIEVFKEAPAVHRGR
jgi:hypothetical protein